MNKSPLLIANEFHPPTVSRLEELFQVYKLWTLAEDRQQALIDELKPHCKAVATASWSTNPLIYQLPALEIIACFGVGVDGIDFGITGSRNIQVTNTPEVLNDAVADLALALILATQRNLVNADGFVRSGQWPAGPFPFGNSLAGKTLGILGLGSIGEAIAARALPFKLNIAYHNRHDRELPYQYFADPGQLAEASDILLSVLPGGASTEKLVDLPLLQRLGSSGTFINVGRGSCVDESALAEALSRGIIAGAGLDVYANEPRVPATLRSMNNVVLLPHIGSATHETRHGMGQLVIDNLLAWQAKEPLITIIS